MIVIDSSVAVAAALPWHGEHDGARRLLANGPRLIAHVALETYSVLTRLPPPTRVPSSAARAFLESAFPDPLIALGADDHACLLRDLDENGIVGGAVYDALVARTAQSVGAVLVSLDRRAAATYGVLGVQHRLLD